LEHQGGFSTADGAGDSDGKGPPGEVALQGAVALVKMSRVFEDFVGVGSGAVVVMRMVGVAHCWCGLCGALGLEESRVKPVVQPLRQFE
jgi:hypothetical protein